MKDLFTEKPKAQGPKLFSAYHYFNNKRLNRKSLEKACRKKKKQRGCQKQWEQHWKRSTQASKVNVAESGGSHPKKNHKNRNYSDKILYDFSLIKYYNCQKMSYYATKYLEPLKTSISPDNLHASD